jgi:enamine deaminase RidA (YjgF/YER057c/UK114 family)
MTRYERSMANPSSVSTPLGRYSQLARVKTGELLFLAGQVAVDADGNMVGKGDVAAQVRQIYKNIGDVLKSAGAGFRNVVQFTTYLPGRELVEPFLEARTEIVDELYPDGDFPPSTLLIVVGLQSEEMLAEVTTIAAI